MAFWSRTVLGVALASTVVGCSSAFPLNATQVQQQLANSAALGDGRDAVVLRFNSDAQLDALAKAGLDLFENVDRQAGTVGAALDAKGRALVASLGVAIQPDLSMARSARAGFPSGYQSVDEVYAGMKALAAKHPSIAKLHEIGQSLEGRPILAMQMTSKPNDAALPSVRIQSGQHSRELPTVELSSRLMATLAEGYGKDGQITALLDSRDVWIVPVVNPDGRHKVQGGSAMWRKNTRNNRGVDTNRNADDHWSQGNSSSWADDYRGEAPFSEPESAAMRDLCVKEKFKVAIDVHNFGGMILWPPGFTTEVSKDEARFRALGDQMGRGTGYTKVGTIARTIYKTYGDFATWEYTQLGTLSFACELGDSGFAAPISQMEKDWVTWKPNFLLLIDSAGNPTARRNSPAEAISFFTR